MLGDDLAGGHELVHVVPRRHVDGLPHDRALEPPRHDDGARLHARLLRGGAPPPSCVAGWPHEAAAIAALTRDGSDGAADTGADHAGSDAVGRTAR